ncbi:IclR family acetate operon transcriptional repressor [Deinococcus metalli]|uniref:IclR family acetate operon transcriptional repressor n=1 Tax=Deinococcus metalli TaxID=1141878 RepID=A0A7W8KHH4_9DEIO|nr:IclR family transcriptional regulator [Deinococcus metalli]MBB5376619.1 IclR family acetate operon transcriptional repressor [Deinococcus metalli]GHF42735.1 IclR family transcriptional regulator [Deinococcus metalli]
MTQATRDVPRYLIQSAALTLEVLLVFGRPPYRYTPSEMAQQLDLDRNQAFRCLRTLQHVGFIRMDEDDRFVLTTLVDQLAAASQPQPTFVSAAQPFMDEVSQSTGETVNLFVLDGDQMTSVDHRDGVRPVRLVTEPGRRTPLHAGACPKAVLAYLPPAEQDALLAQLPSLPRFTPHTELDPDALRAELGLTRLRGYAISDLDIDEEARGVGAPIFNASGHAIGAISVGGPASRMTPSRLAELGDTIRSAAQRISRQLGHNRSPSFPLE